MDEFNETQWGFYRDTLNGIRKKSADLTEKERSFFLGGGMWNGKPQKGAFEKPTEWSISPGQIAWIARTAERLHIEMPEMPVLSEQEDVPYADGTLNLHTLDNQGVIQINTPDGYKQIGQKLGTGQAKLVISWLAVAMQDIIRLSGGTQPKETEGGTESGSSVPF